MNDEYEATYNYVTFKFTNNGLYIIFNIFRWTYILCLDHFILHPTWRIWLHITKRTRIRSANYVVSDLKYNVPCGSNYSQLRSVFGHKFPLAIMEWANSSVKINFWRNWKLPSFFHGPCLLILRLSLFYALCLLILQLLFIYASLVQAWNYVDGV